MRYACCGALIIAVLGIASGAVYGQDQQIPLAALPPLNCQALQTGGFHDYPEDDERYVPALFNPASFDLEVNELFMQNLDPGKGGPDLYLVMRDSDEMESELQCRRVRGADGALGYSCVNTPPSEMLLVNVETFRFTRTAVGGWTFSSASESSSGDSIFVEYGLCAPIAAPSEPQATP